MQLDSRVVDHLRTCDDKPVQIGSLVYLYNKDKWGIKRNYPPWNLRAYRVGIVISIDDSHVKVAQVL